jgi:hypothetical protein
MWLNKKSSMAKVGLSISFILFLTYFTNNLAAFEYKLSSAQTLYVPVYANIFTGPKQISFNLTAILSMRNTDLSNAIKILSADYYDTQGKLIKRYYSKEVVLKPLESAFIYLPEDDTSGGIGANFIIKWSSPKEVNTPIVECLMIGLKSGQGVSFISPGQVIKENTN